MKKQYTKPAMMVYRLKTQSQLLQASVPIYNEETEYQW